MATFSERYQLRGTLGGNEHAVNLSQSPAYTNIIDHVITIGTTEVQLFTDGTAVAGATLTDFDYFYVENLEATNYMEIGLKQTGAADVAFFRLPAGKHFAIYSQSFQADGADEAIGTANTIVDISGRFNTAAGLCRIIVAT